VTVVATPNLLAEAHGLADQLVAVRRTIHRRPELGLQNPDTQQVICAELDRLEIPYRTGDGLTSVVATIEGARPGPTIVLRADTDALPMQEDTDWEDRSEIDGRAHVCGHDAHVAMLLGGAELLQRHRDRLRGAVRLAFQPGEEGDGGMRVMLEEGLLSPDDSGAPPVGAFAIHITPNLPVGLVAARVGAAMASTDDFRVEIVGRGGHASTPHLANDPVPVAAEVVIALQTMVTRRINAFEPAVITVAHLTAGTTTNVIPESVLFEGTIRTTSEATRAQVREAFSEVVNHIAAAHGCTARIELRAGYPVTVNHGSVVQRIRGAVEAMAEGPAFIEMPWPVMGAEDVSYLFQQVPGAMAFLGVCPDDITDSFAAPSCHSNLMRLNEAALPVGAALHATVALNWTNDAGTESRTEI
jgi:hippurate hydrolase